MSDLNLKELERKLDKALKKETPESLKKWLASKRQVTDKQIEKKALSEYPRPKSRAEVDYRDSFIKGATWLRDLQPKTADCEHNWKVRFVDKKPKSRFCPLCKITEYFEIDGFGKKRITKNR